VIHRHPFLSLLTAAYLAFVGWLTLTPQPLDAGDQDLILRGLAALHRRGYLESVDYTRLEFLANIGLFVPVGAFLVLLLGARWWWVALLACVAMTGFIETAQQAIPGRVPDERDLVANSLGAGIGVLVALVLTAPAEIRHARARKAARRSSTPRLPVGR
jgi:VanZ family protein